MDKKEVVSGVGAKSSRTDQNISERVAKIQREAKIQNASGGAYSQRTQLEQLATAASTETPTAIFNPAPISNQSMMSNVRVSPLDQMDTSGDPISTGAAGRTAGAGPEVLQVPVDAPDNNALVARAMFLMDPTPQNRRLMESFQQEGR
jgi:hypothetical protein